MDLLDSGTSRKGERFSTIGASVPELTKTFPVRVPCPLNVPLCGLKLMFLQTKIDASSINPFTLKFALLTLMVP